MGFLVGAMPWPEAPAPGEPLVGLVVETYEQADEYLEKGTSPQGYVIILTAADVPARLGGLALLAEGDLEPALRDALVRALGIHGTGAVPTAGTLRAEE